MIDDPRLKEYPDRNERKPFAVCQVCGETIYYDDDYFDFDDDIVCENCTDEYISIFKRTAEED